ncbi:MAG: exodeoxyribonuclease VII small subunit [Oscillospiraceae bacterium]|nr:exodeoxyribonuclease VII small subunit [Oscillospiraceae bacterium]
MTFEASMARLEEIVSLLNNGNISLEESLALYAEGAKLLSECEKHLSDARVKIETLAKGENA